MFIHSPNLEIIFFYRKTAMLNSLYGLPFSVLQIK